MELDRRLLKPRPIVEKLLPGTESLINHWNALKLTPCNKGTKAYEEAYDKLNKLRAGTLFNGNPLLSDFHNRRFLKEETMEVFEKYSLASHSPEYLPRDKSKMSKANLSVFLYNPWTSSSYSKSLFLTWYEKELVRIEPETKPEITNRLIARYRYEILGRNDWLPSEVQRMKFVRAANRVWDFLMNKKVLHNLPYAVKRETVADWLFDSVIRQNFDSVHPGHFCSDYVINTALPSYLVSQGVMGVTNYSGRN